MCLSRFTNLTTIFYKHIHRTILFKVDWFPIVPTPALTYLSQGCGLRGGSRRTHAHFLLHLWDVIRAARKAELGSVGSIWTGPRLPGSPFARRRRWRTKRKERRMKTPPTATESPWKKKLDFWALALLSSVSVWQLLLYVLNSRRVVRSDEFCDKEKTDKETWPSGKLITWPMYSYSFSVKVRV